MKARAFLAALALVAAGLTAATPATAAAPVTAAAAGLPTTVVAPDGKVGFVSKAPASPGGSLKGHPSVKKTQSGGVAARAGVPVYNYSGGRQTGGTPAMSSLGGSAYITVQNYFRNPDAYHVLMETSAEKVVGGLRQITEVGVNVDSVVNGGTNAPHLFVGRWVNNVFQGYNGADPGWFNYCATSPCTTPQAGTSLAAHVGTAKQVAVVYSPAASPAGWWVSYNGLWVGGWTQAAWTAAGVTFTDASMVQWFGETVNNSLGSTCSDMGNGKFGSTITSPLDPTGATDPSYFSSVSLASGNQTSAATAIANTNASWFDSGFLTARTFGVGGPGSPPGSGGGTGSAGMC